MSSTSARLAVARVTHMRCAFWGKAGAVLSAQWHRFGDRLPWTAVESFGLEAQVDQVGRARGRWSRPRRPPPLARVAHVRVSTHLPQVAAVADRHLVVVKSDDGSVTSSGVVALDENGRVNELSRMLAGLEGSELAKGHAGELLATASGYKRGL